MSRVNAPTNQIQGFNNLEDNAVLTGEELVQLNGDDQKG